MLHNVKFVYINTTLDDNIYLSINPDKSCP